MLTVSFILAKMVALLEVVLGLVVVTVVCVVLEDVDELGIVEFSLGFSWIFGAVLCSVSLVIGCLLLSFVIDVGTFIFKLCSEREID